MAERTWRRKTGTSGRRCLKHYDSEMHENGTEHILKLGIAFSGKKVVVRTA